MSKGAKRIIKGKRCRLGKLLRMFIVFILFPSLKISIRPNYHIVITTLIGH
jgi:hypothetical protein